MRGLLLPFLPCGLLLGIAAPGANAGDNYLCQPTYTMDEEERGPSHVYAAQPGDIYMSTDKLFWARAGHFLAFSGAPHHSGIVVARSDGRMAMLEAGPFNGIWVEIVDLDYCLAEHQRRREIVWIRQRRTPLTAEQSASLTKWAESQDGKRFAVFRLLGQITLFRSRGPLRTYFMGGPHGERSAYFCSELVMESCVHVGLLDPATTRPSATYPRDLFFDQSMNRFLSQHFTLADGWFPPARWVTSPAIAVPVELQQHVAPPE
jgi:hypothetical protein